MREGKMIHGKNNDRSEEEFQAFHEMVEEHHDQLLRFIKKEVGFLCLEEDILNDTLLQAWNSFHDAHDKSTLKAWLFVISANLCKNARKNAFTNKKRYEELYERNKSMIDEFYDSLNPELITIDKELLLNALAFLDSLSDRKRKIYYDRYVENKPISEIAHEHCMSERGVAKCLAKIRQSLSLKTKDLVIAYLVFRLSQPMDRFLSQSYGHLEGRVSSDTSVFEAAPAVVDTMTDQAFQVAETATVGAGAAATVVKSISALLLAAAMPFLWLMSALIGGQVCGLAFVRNALTTPIRRWLVQQLFICYCGTMLIPIYFLCLHKSLIFLMSGWHAKYHLPLLLGCLIFIPVIIYLRRFHVTYQKLQNDSNAFMFHELTFYRLNRVITRGFRLITILLMVFGGLFLLWVVLPNHEACSKAKQWEQCHFIVFYTIAIFFVFGYYHVSNFFLFRYFLAISKDDQIMISSEIPPPFSKNVLNFSFIGEFAYMFLFVILTLTPALLHICLKNTRPVFASAELAGCSLCWSGVLFYCPGHIKLPLCSSFEFCVFEECGE